MIFTCLHLDAFACGWHLELDLVMMCIENNQIYISTSDSNAFKFLLLLVAKYLELLVILS